MPFEITFKGERNHPSKADSRLREKEMDQASFIYGSKPGNEGVCDEKIFGSFE